jgi:hypothetical protein
MSKTDKTQFRLIFVLAVYIFFFNEIQFFVAVKMNPTVVLCKSIEQNHKTIKLKFNFY